MKQLSRNETAKYSREFLKEKNNFVKSEEFFQTNGVNVLMNISTNSSDKFMTPLMYCCAGGLETLVKAALAAGADVNCFVGKYNALSNAIESGESGVVKLLLESKKLDFEILAAHNYFPLHYVAHFGKKDLVKLLIQHGVPIDDTPSQDNFTVLQCSLDAEHLTVQHVEIAALLLQKNPKLQLDRPIPFQGEGNFCSLLGFIGSRQALTLLDLQATQLLLDKGADPNQTLRLNGEMFNLLERCMILNTENHHKLILQLLNKGADYLKVSEKAKLSRAGGSKPASLLEWAAFQGLQPVVEKLYVLYGEKKRPIDSDTLCSAVFSGNLPLVKYLVEKAKVDINLRSEFGFSPVMQACASNHTDIVQYLLNKGVNTSLVDLQGVNLLHVAAMVGNLSLVKELVENKKLSVNQETSNKTTPLTYAVEYGHPQVAKYLLDKRAKIFIRNDEGNSLLIAIQEREGLSTQLAQERSDAKKRRELQLKIRAYEETIKYLIMSYMPEFVENITICYEEAIKVSLGEMATVCFSVDYVVKEAYRNQNLGGLTGDSSSPFAALRELGFDDDQIKQMMREAKEKPPEAVVPKVEKTPKVEEVYSWFDGRLTSDRVTVIDIRLKSYFYLDEKALEAQGCSEAELEQFKKTLIKFDSKLGLKPLNNKKLSRDVMIDGKPYLTNATHELKTQANASRVLCLRREENGAMCYLACWYSKGLHTPGETKSAENTSSAIELNLPPSSPSPKKGDDVLDNNNNLCYRKNR